MVAGRELDHGRSRSAQSKGVDALCTGKWTAERLVLPPWIAALAAVGALPPTQKEEA